MVFAQAEEGFLKNQLVDKQGDTLQYCVLYPKDYGQQKKYPLILFLHGAGERGSDNKKQLTHGSRLFLNEENREQFPAIVLFPQCPEDDFWSSVKITRRGGGPVQLDFNYPGEPTPSLQQVLELIKHIRKTEAVDKDRIYVMGLSMGGMGTFELLAREPRLFAAAIPICGGGNPDDASKYAKQVPVWIFHGAKDDIVSPENSRIMVKALKEQEAAMKYTEYPDAGHDSWDQAFAEPDLLEWLFAQSR